MEAQLGTQKRRGLGGQSSLNPFEGAPAHFVGGVSDFIRSPISGGQKPNILTTWLRDATTVVEQTFQTLRMAAF